MADTAYICTPSRPGFRLLWTLLLSATTAVLCVGAGGAATVSAADQRVALADRAGSGNWQSHNYRFQYLGANVTYGCVGLTDKLLVLLRTTGVHDLHANPVCLGHYLPQHFPQADLSFETLVPSSASADTSRSAHGVWHRVTWTPDNPQTVGHGDCALVEQMLHDVLPLLTTRNLQTRFDCTQNHDYGSFSVSFDAFAPADSH